MVNGRPCTSTRNRTSYGLRLRGVRPIPGFALAAFRAAPNDTRVRWLQGMTKALWGAERLR